jgi:acyl carrier protein
VVASVWAEVLGVDRIGTTDNFFQLGGHSLHAAQVIGRLERILRTQVSVRQLFAHPTVTDLVHALREDTGDAARLDRIAAVIVEVRDLSPLQRLARLNEGDLS